MPPRLNNDPNWTTACTPVTVNYGNYDTITVNAGEYHRWNNNPFWIDLTNTTATTVNSNDLEQYRRNEAMKSAARWFQNTLAEHGRHKNTASVDIWNTELVISNIIVEESLNSEPVYTIEIDYYGTTIEIEAIGDKSCSALKDIVMSGKSIHDLAAYCAENKNHVTWHCNESGYCNGVDAVFMNALEKKELEVNEADWKSLFAATSAAGS